MVATEVSRAASTAASWRATHSLRSGMKLSGAPDRRSGAEGRTGSGDRAMAGATAAGASLFP
ncbi:hypothetical protein GCM10011509_26330 [Ornithinimicrobium pekingense]|uniref:Uncharacterized protein n=1 Tax=Ornithinimicrobium pekingense TaxID=384677 RepID=A0ABQ2FDB7_9MICO|nr:hypothetical protein GCM10011509_26330 [Ornithinimicrobium pekingense]